MEPVIEIEQDIAIFWNVAAFGFAVIIVAFFCKSKRFFSGDLKALESLGVHGRKHC